MGAAALLPVAGYTIPSTKLNDLADLPRIFGQGFGLQITWEIPPTGRSMRQSRFKEDHMVSIIRETDRDPFAMIVKRLTISEQKIAPTVSRSNA